MKTPLNNPGRRLPIGRLLLITSDKDGGRGFSFIGKNNAEV